MNFTSKRPKENDTWTYAQCMATASGTGDVCGENPQYLFKAQRRGGWPPR